MYRICCYHNLAFRRIVVHRRLSYLASRNLFLLIAALRVNPKGSDDAILKMRGKILLDAGCCGGNQPKMEKTKGAILDLIALIEAGNYVNHVVLAWCLGPSVKGGTLFSDFVLRRSRAEAFSHSFLSNHHHLQHLSRGRRDATAER